MIGNVIRGTFCCTNTETNALAVAAIKMQY